jgi:hypothetical protein
MASKLRTAFAKLARENPSFRQALTKELRASLMIGDEMTVDRAKMHLHRYRDQIQVTDLTFAGKRGKRVERFSVVDLDYAHGGWAHDLVEALAKASSYKAALALAKKMLEDYEGSGSPSVHEYTLRGIDVMPAGVSPVTLNGKHVWIKATPIDFIVRDKDDQHNLPTCIPATRGGKKSIPVFYRWLLENESQIERMTFHDVMKSMSDAGIQSHQYCAMD